MNLWQNEHHLTNPGRVRLPTVLWLALVLLLGMLGAGSLHAQTAAAPLWPVPPATAGEFKAGELLVQFRPEMPAGLAAAVPAEYGAAHERYLYRSSVALWRVPAGQELAIAAQLNADPRIAFAEPNYRYTVLDTIPNDPQFSRQWAHPIMQSPAGWDLTVGNSGITLAVIDTGIDLNHPDLAGRLVPGYDFVDNDSVPRDGFGHGTHVAGIAAAITNNGTGVAGVDWLARIMPIRSLDDQGSGYSSDVTDGIVWAYTQGADVLNLSLGGPDYSQAMQNAVNSAHAAGTLVVAAMGNSRTEGNPTNYPAGLNNVLAVSATTRTDQYAYYSQYGPHNDVAAPGGQMYSLHDSNGIYSTLPTYYVFLNGYGYSQNYDYLQGTSMAAPQVAGLATLLLAMNPALSPDQVQAVIQATAVDLGPAGWDPDYGHGRINIYAALFSQIPAPAPPNLLPIDNADGDGSYLVDWQASPWATLYELEEATNPGFTDAAVVYSGAATELARTGRGPGSYFYRVRAQNQAGSSGWSNIQATTVVPNAPTLLAISNGGQNDAYQVSWTAALAASGYLLQEDDNASFSSPTTRYMGSAQAYQVTGQPGGTWYYRVQAYNQGGSSPWSSSQSTMVAASSLASPVLAAIDNGDGDGAYMLDWSAVGGATGYIVEQSANPFFVQPTQVYSGTATTLAVTDQPGGTWHYRVRAVSASDAGPWSNVRAAVVTAYQYLPWLQRP